LFAPAAPPFLAGGALVSFLVSFFAPFAPLSLFYC